jgi:hypothetical protein
MLLTVSDFLNWGVNPRLLFSFRNRNPSSGHLVGSGTKQLQAEETFEATGPCRDAAVDGPTQLAAHDAVPVGANLADVLAVQELQKPSKSDRLAVKC